MLPTFEVEPTAANHFAWLRTRFAADRTFLAWLRTAASLIGFGFTIVEFFSRLAAMQGVAPAHRPHAPVWLGLMLIGGGVLSLGLALVQYLHTMQHMESGELGAIAGAPPSKAPPILLAVAMLLIGLFAFTAILVRAGVVG